MSKKRDTLVYIEDVLESFDKILRYTENLTEKEFEANDEKQDAVIRRIEIVGEAIKSVPDDIRLQYPRVPWRAMAGMRDILIHQYFGVSIANVWKVVTSDIPKLKEEIEKVKTELLKNKG